MRKTVCLDASIAWSPEIKGNTTRFDRNPLTVLYFSPVSFQKGEKWMPEPSEPSAFDTFLEARFKLLQEGNPPEHGEEGWRALFSPEFFTRLLAESKLDGGGGLPPQNITPTVAGIPFTISRHLPADHLAVLFCGRDPFDPEHPERTVVITRGGE